MKSSSEAKHKVEADMRDHGCAQLPVSINIGYREFSQQNYIADIARRLAEADLPAADLELEINEKVLVRNLQLSGDGVEGTAACWRRC